MDVLRRNNVRASGPEGDPDVLFETLARHAGARPQK
jgi:hypothetical protein